LEVSKVQELTFRAKGVLAAAPVAMMINQK